MSFLEILQEILVSEKSHVKGLAPTKAGEGGGKTSVSLKPAKSSQVLVKLKYVILWPSEEQKT